MAKLLHDKLTVEEQSNAMKYMIATKWWKLLEEWLRAKKLDLINKILLKKGMINWVMTRLAEEQIDDYRKELVDIDYLLKLPESYIQENKKDDPDTELTEEHYKEELNFDVLT